MSNKKLRVQRAGVGDFPFTGRSPEMVLVTSDPLHTSDEWERNGRPFWLVAWLMDGRCSDPAAGEYMVGRTMTPTFCPLSVVGIPPIRAVRVVCGTVTERVPAEWREVSDIRTANRLSGRTLKLNPVRLVTWDRKLTWESAQQYATPGGIDTARPTPVTTSETEYRGSSPLLNPVADDGSEPTAAPFIDGGGV